MSQPLPGTGIYALVLRAQHQQVVRVGGLGRRRFSPGYYVYVGSALNSLPSRILRHLTKSKKKHWHIDYLTTHLWFAILGVAWKSTEGGSNANSLKCSIVNQ